MNYQTFKTQFLSELQNQVTKGYPDYTLHVDTVEKIGITKTGVSILKENINDYVTVSVYYVEDIYLDYTKDSSSMPAFVKDFLKHYFEIEAPKGINPKEIMDIDYISKNIFCQVINYEFNKKYLETVPHRKFLDLAIIYRIYLSEDDQHKAMISFIVANEFLKSINLSEEDLYKMALANTENILEPHLKDGILTSTGDIYGSSFLVCRSKLRGLNRDLIIIPVSADCLFILPANYQIDFKRIKYLLVSKSAEQIKSNRSVDCFLSTNIYTYDHVLDTLSIKEG